MWERMGTRGRVAADAAVALTAGAFTIVMLNEGGLGTAEPGYRDLDVLGVVLAVATVAPLLVARRFPGFAWGVIAPASLLLIAGDYGFDVPPGPLIAICVLAEAVGGGDTPRRRLLAAVSVAVYLPVAFILMIVAGKSLTNMSSGLFAWAVMFALVWIAGDRSRLRHERIAELEERARLREQEMAAQRRLAAAEERTRIARELHDSAGHAINVILVQAGAARLLHQRDPERSRHAIETIEEVAHSTIADIDRLVRALRSAPADSMDAPRRAATWAGTKQGAAAAGTKQGDAAAGTKQGDAAAGTMPCDSGAGPMQGDAHPATASAAEVTALPDAMSTDPDAIPTDSAPGRAWPAGDLLTGTRPADVMPADPAPAGTAALEQLVDRHRAGGLRVAATFHGAPRGLSSGVAWAAFRILQEALTNAARHGSGSADVRMSYGSAAVDIEVSNPVGDLARPGGGMGIIGMRERAALLDGTLDAGSSENGMFRVRARLPYAARAPMGILA